MRTTFSSLNLNNIIFVRSSLHIDWQRACTKFGSQVRHTINNSEYRNNYWQDLTFFFLMSLSFNLKLLLSGLLLLVDVVPLFKLLFMPTSMIAKVSFAVISIAVSRIVVKRKARDWRTFITRLCCHWQGDVGRGYGCSMVAQCVHTNLLYGDSELLSYSPFGYACSIQYRWS